MGKSNGNNVTIALNVFYAKKEKLCPACVWKYQIAKNMVFL